MPLLLSFGVILVNYLDFKCEMRDKHLFGKDHCLDNYGRI